ncbi:YbaB/EbfC family DNA-binding protein [Micromonospora sp. NPDC049799]|uniref:YbaB/EbfC family DNA-binding protein n=1 Tax=Micromonospora sp. NPDC049799 TaxID=3154741 RepID=UPI0033C59842
MWADEAALDATARRIDDWESSIAERAARARALAAQIQALTGNARSPDRMVEVTVDSAGLLTDLRLDERTRQHAAALTARQILQTALAARHDLLRQVTEITTQALGAGDPTAAALVASYWHRLDPDQGPSDAGR